MVIDRFSFTPFNFNGFQGGYGSIQDHNVEVQGECSSISIMELLGDINPIPSTEQEKEPHFLKEQNFLHNRHDFMIDNLMLEEFNFDPAPQPPQPFQACNALLKNQAVGAKTSSQLIGHGNKQVAPRPPPPPQPPTPHSLASSLEILNNYRSRFKRLSGRSLSNTETDQTPQKLSTEQIIRVAGVRYVQYSSQWQDNFFSISMRSYYEFGMTGLFEEENRYVELAQFLLAAAERVACQQFERARTLLLHCQLNSSAIGNPVHRVVFHFAQALRERMNKEILGGDRIGQKGSQKNPEREMIEELQGDTTMAFTCHQKLPFNQVMQFAGVQAVVEHVASRTKIHLIDLDVGYGLLSTILMQALAERKDRPVELLKITAIGHGGKRELLEDAGKGLVSFAETLNLPLLYKSVFVVDIIELREDHFEIEDDEAVAVFCPYLLRTIVSKPDSLDNLMRMIRKIKPAVLIVLEVEANHNSPSFVNRFIEALFFYSAYFDCVETCLKHDNECRMRLEAVLSEGIRNIVAMENRERTVRNVKIDVWRRFFTRFKMVETGFSESSLYQANLVVKKFPFGNLCTVEKNEKCIIVGWKGTPIHSLSAWKFI